MSVKLKNVITYIKYGLHAPTRSQGEIKYLKGNHFDDDARFTMFSDSYVNADDISGQHLLQENDVIMASKGYRNFAWRYTADIGPCVASSIFYVIRVNEEVIASEYFVLLMNSSMVMHQIKMAALGATMPAIPKNELLAMKISIPSLASQQEIIDISNTINKKISLERNLLNQSLKLKKGLINKLITKEL